MQGQTKEYTEEHIEAALAGSDIAAAITLWRVKDWDTYRSTCEALVWLIRSGRSAEVGMPQMQFLYFINTHLRHRISTPDLSDWRVFMTEFPDDQFQPDRAWATATAGRFWTEPI